MERKLRHSLTVEPFHTDCFGRLSLPVLGTHLLNVAHRHGASHSFGADSLGSVNGAWVLARLVLEMSEWPLVHQSFVIETWLEKLYRNFVERNYLFYDLQGLLLGRAKTVWSLLDSQSRRPLRLTPSLEQSVMSVLLPESNGLSLPARFVPVGEVVERGRFVPGYTDLDINGHVNSMRYIGELLNLFPLPYLQSHPLCSLEVSYAAESYVEDVLTISGWQESVHSYAFRFHRGEELLVSARFLFS